MLRTEHTSEDHKEVEAEVEGPYFWRTHFGYRLILADPKINLIYMADTRLNIL